MTLTGKAPKEKYGIKLTATINNSPLPVLIEYPDGRENPIIKAYFVTGRAAAIKILVGVNDELTEREYEVRSLTNENAALQNEVDEANGYEEELREWTNNFDGTADDVKAQWDAIEESISQFADTAGMRLTANDATNIDALHDIYKTSISNLKDADEIIGELKLENLAAKRKIAELEEKTCGLGVK